MEREILYRGKRMDNGEWVYGWYCEHSFGRWPLKSCIIPSEKAVNGCIEHVEIDPATLGQYTGLTDKNGAKIFEGDIVRYIYEPGEGFWNANQLSVIMWDHTGFKMDGIIGTNKFALLQGWLVSVPCDKSYFEVVGNIHDNPELMERINDTE